MKRPLTKYTLFFFALFLTNTFSQGIVTIDPNTKRYVGSESAFERDKYLTFHSWFKKNDLDFERFKSEYNINLSYNGSRQFNNPGGRHKNGKFPKIKLSYTGVRDVSDVVSTGSPKFLFYDKNSDYSVTDISDFSKQAAQFAADFFSKQADVVPRYFEPLNEPMVHAREYLGTVKKIKNRQQKVNIVVEKIIDYHADVVQAIRSNPQLKHMTVGGFGSAFPEFEANNFGLWKNRFKKFIDKLGSEIDFLALHLYDGSGINNKNGRRSGSNSEAILDMLEAYSFIKTGKTIPYAITEYGRLVPDQPNFKQNGNYVPLVNAQAVRSQLHLVMNFIERGDKLLLSTPFTVGKQQPKSRYSKSSLWIKQDDGTFELSQRKYFFEVWKDVKGDRVRINSTNIDVQTQAFVNGNQLYVILNNLNDSSQQVSLNLLDTNEVKSVTIKRLSVSADKLPVLSIKSNIKAPETLRLDYGETVVLTYMLKTKIKFKKQVFSRNYYANTYLQPINANTAIPFVVNCPTNSNEDVILRLGVARNHGQSLSPQLMINGKKISYSGDVIRGYDQKTRKRFFGVLEIPLLANDIKVGDNKIEVSFPEKGGHVTSVILKMNTELK